MIEKSERAEGAQRNSTLSAWPPLEQHFVSLVRYATFALSNFLVPPRPVEPLHPKDTPMMFRSLSLSSFRLSSRLSNLSRSLSTSPRSPASYPYSLPVQTRWTDNDQYLHMNNAHYISLFDTAINTFLIKEAKVLDHEAVGSGARGGEGVGFCVESKANYFKPVAFPELLKVGVRGELLRAKRSEATKR